MCLWLLAAVCRNRWFKDEALSSECRNLQYRSAEKSTLIQLHTHAHKDIKMYIWAVTTAYTLHVWRFSFVFRIKPQTDTERAATANSSQHKFVFLCRREIISEVALPLSVYCILQTSEVGNKSVHSLSVEAKAKVTEDRHTHASKQQESSAQTQLSSACFLHARSAGKRISWLICSMWTK